MAPAHCKVSLTDRLAYVAHCASCGELLDFEADTIDPRLESAVGICQCGRRWAFVFDIDPSGTFGVMSFQCGNGDRITSATARREPNDKDKADDHGDGG